jgi:hypothetical protein
MELDALAPDAVEAEPEEEEAVFDMGALAPDEPVMELDALAPDAVEAEPEEEEAVFDMGTLAPDEPVMELDALAPDAVEAEPEEEEAVFDMGTLAPDEPVMELDALAPDAVEADDISGANDGPLATRTMADLYARQGLTSRALDVYRSLLKVSPADAELRRRVQALEGELQDGGGSTQEAMPEAPPFLDVDEGDDEDLSDNVWNPEAQAAGHEVDTPFAWTDETEDAPAAGPPISSYFQRLLSWESPGGAEGEDTGPSVSDGDPETLWDGV